MDYKLEKLCDKVYCLSCDHSYDVGMLFLRASETKESMLPEFLGVFWKLIDFMEAYAKSKFAHDNVFSYPEDWAGFNLRRNDLEFVYSKPDLIPDLNKYDEIMIKVLSRINEEMGSQSDFALMGIVKDDVITKKHEFAHALFAINKDYKEKALNLNNNLPEKTHQLLIDFIGNMGYPSSVIEDEIQAYLSTGLTNSMRAMLNRNNISAKEIRKNYISLFKKFNIIK
jgi:hypothetical protein